MLFFQRFWDVVEQDVIKLCNDFYLYSSNLERINWANIVLIPKSQHPAAISNFRPISLINSFLKIISKILAMCLAKVIGNLVTRHNQCSLGVGSLWITLWQRKRLFLVFKSEASPVLLSRSILLRLLTW